MSKSLEIIIGFITAAIIGSFGATSAALAAGHGDLNNLAIGLIILTGAATGARDVRSLLKMSPVKQNDGGDTTTIVKKP